MVLNHVALTVSNRDRSAAFYSEHFDLGERVHEDDYLLILGGAGGALLALSTGVPPSNLPRTNHFGFRVSSSDEVRAARSRWRKAGVEETEWQEDSSFVRLQVVDPDGYRVDLFAY